MKDTGSGSGIILESKWKRRGKKMRMFRNIIFGLLIMVFSLSLFGKGKILFEENFDSIKLSELVKKGVVEIPKYNHWKIEKGALVQAQPKYYTGRIIIGNKNWIITKIEFDFKRIEYGLPTKYGYDNHTGVRIWGLTIWAREKFLQWSGHIPKMGKKPQKVGRKKASFELNKWYHFKAEREKDGKVKVYINNLLFTTIPYSPKERGPVEFYTYRIKSAFDNLKIYGVEKKFEEKKEGTYNFVPNSSFEYTTNPDLPDCWTSYNSVFHWGLHDGKWTTASGYEEWHKKFAVDRSISFHGKNSLRVEYPVGISSTFFDISGGKEYVLSAYLKSDKGDFPVKVILFYPYRKKIIEKEVKAGKEWNRIFMKVKIPDVSKVYLAFIPLKEGTLWVDAVQLEQGVNLTSYTPSPSDEKNFGKRKSKVKTVITQIPSVVLKNEVNIPPAIDGKLDDFSWEKVSSNFLRRMNGEQTDTKTEFKVCYDKKNIYIGIKCYMSEGGNRIIAGKWERDSLKVFGEDSVEIFITPQENPQKYFHLAINAVGVIFDQECEVGKGNNIKWNGIWNIKTGRGKNFWTVEIAIPFENFIKEKMNIGKVFRVNICRNYPQKRELLSWSPTLTGFHVPDRFGYLYLGFSPVGVSVENFALIWKNMREKEMSFSVENREERKLNLEISLLSFPEKKRYLKQISINPGEKKKVNFNIFSWESKFEGSIDIVEKKTGDLIYSKEIDLKAPPSLKTYFELSYYTNEENAKLIYLFNFPFQSFFRIMHPACRRPGGNE